MKPRDKQNLSRRLAFLRLWGLALAVMMLTGGTFYWLFDRLQDPSVVPVRFVEIEGEVRYLDLEHLQEVLHRSEDGGFFSVTLARMRDEVQSLPWVDSVSLRRVWPDTLRVRVVEQRPMARWGDTALLNHRGEIFSPEPMPDFSALTRLDGEPEDSVEISRSYQKIRILLDTVDLELSRVRVDARQAWRLWTRKGLELELGRKQIMPRLSRFVRLYPELSKEQGLRLKLVDLRYPNGFTASWEALPELHVNGAIPELKGQASRLAGI